MSDGIKGTPDMNVMPPLGDGGQGDQGAPPSDFQDTPATPVAENGKTHQRASNGQEEAIDEPTAKPKAALPKHRKAPKLQAGKGRGHATKDKPKQPRQKRKRAKPAGRRGSKLQR